MKWRAKDSIESENSLAAASFLSFSLSHLNTLTHILSPVHTLLLLFLATKAKYNSLLLSLSISLVRVCVMHFHSLFSCSFSLSLSLAYNLTITRMMLEARSSSECFVHFQSRPKKISPKHFYFIFCEKDCSLQFLK